jgi:uncharacterized protein YqgC (DUF456 family)
LSPLEIGGLTLFIMVLLIGTFSIVFGFPGTAIILIDAFVYAAITGFERIGVKILLTLTVLSVLAEVADFAVGMAGTVKVGASRTGFWAFFIGGIIGAFLMTPFLLGLGLVVGIFFGGFAGMLAVELLHRNTVKPTLRTPLGAVLGRAAGICVKGFFALIMIIITLTSVYS